MSDRNHRSRAGRAARWPLALTLALVTGALAGCDDLLDVELPGEITEDGTFQAGQAEVLVNSAIADLECSMSDFIASNAAGSEDVSARSVGWWGSVYEFGASPGTANCSIAETSFGWFTPLHKGRWMAEQAYDRLENEWTVEQVPDRERLMGTAAIYAGLAYTQLGEYFCETSANTGPLMSPEEALTEAEEWFTAALGHISAAGDFSIATGVTSSAEQMARLLRARARFAKDDFAGAAADASEIEQGFISWITRESGGERTRWNRVYSAHVAQGWVPLLGPIDWWDGGPDPVSGQPWPDTIPFTGYWDLAVLPDGRAVSDRQHPITLDDVDAVEDPRVPVAFMNDSAGPNQYPLWRPEKYLDAGADYPLAKWEEAWLILAQIEGGQTAVDLVNDIRNAHGLPEVDYLDPSDEEAVQDMLIEEIRRTHFLEGRYWATKLRYDLWFPRGEGADMFAHNYNTGVRLVMPNNEFELNENFEPSARGSLCEPHHAPEL